MLPVISTCVATSVDIQYTISMCLKSLLSIQVSLEPEVHKVLSDESSYMQLKIMQQQYNFMNPIDLRHVAQIDSATLASRPKRRYNFFKLNAFFIMNNEPFLYVDPDAIITGYRPLLDQSLSSRKCSLAATYYPNEGGYWNAGVFVSSGGSYMDMKKLLDVDTYHVWRRDTDASRKRKSSGDNSLLVSYFRKQQCQHFVLDACFNFRNYIFQSHCLRSPFHIFAWHHKLFPRWTSIVTQGNSSSLAVNQEGLRKANSSALALYYIRVLKNLGWK